MRTDLNILYEDKDMIVLYKPAGMAVQNARMGAMDLEHMLLNYLAQTDGAGRSMPYVGVVHRLDQPVEGILVFGKNSKATAALNRQLAKTMDKRYLAVVQGKMSSLKGTLIDYLKKEPRENRSHTAPKKDPFSKEAVLEYRVIAQTEESLLEIHLHTGRHHQIRVQLAQAGHPIVGDLKYGTVAGSGKYPALCAYKLIFEHPLTKKKMKYQISPEGVAFQPFEKEILKFL